MKLTSGSSEKKTTLGVLAGIIKGLSGIVMSWFGLNSLVVGLAYSNQKGFWVVCLTGMIALIIGLVVLLAGVRQIFRNTSLDKDY